MKKKYNLIEYKNPLIILIFLISILLLTNIYLDNVDYKSNNLEDAPELKGISGYINTDENISIKKLIEDGNVVLIDFWTYSCINCKRTLPYLKEWDRKYSDKGLVIIGVHTPEFGFEKDYNNVLDAVKTFEIEYPVVQDNNYETWTEFKNNYWPRKYLIDINGKIVYDKIGEGGYEETEIFIKKLLNERALKYNLEEIDNEISIPNNIFDVNFSQIKSPEIYFGYKFFLNRNYIGNFNIEGIDKIFTYKLPNNLKFNTAYLDGEWLITQDYSDLISDNGVIEIIYYSKNVNIVAGGNGTINVYLDGINKEKIKINEYKLYNIISLDEYNIHTLRIEFEEDIKIYSFTFG